MTDAWRKGLVFAAGLLLGGALAVWAYQAWVAPKERATPSAAIETPLESAPATPAPEAVVTPVPPQSVAAALTGACPFEPMVAPGPSGDGQFSLRAALSTSAPADPGAFLKVAEEAAGQGRPRDAEVALIVACRAAAQTAGWPSAPAADVKSELGQHYADLGARERDSGPRLELLRRAEILFGESAQAYETALGRNASKTRLAGQRLAAVTQAAAQVAAAPAGSADASGQATDAAAATLGAAKAMAEDQEALAAQEAAAATGCAAARSAAERAVCADAELAQMDRDLDRLSAQARAVTRDPGGFAQRQEQAWAQREAQCRGNTACLRNWYAQRKRQLFSEF